MRVAIVTPVLSHFEVPLFRLASGLPGLDVKVFHRDEREDNSFDEQYGKVIDWGERLRSGYDNAYFTGMAELERDLFNWSPRVLLQYGYLWQGGFGLLAKARMRKIPVVHRGLLTPYANTRSNPILTKGWRTIQPMFLRRFQAHHYGGTYSETVLEKAGIPEDRRYFVPFSIDTPYFAARADDPMEAESARAMRRALGWSEDAPVLLFICQHSYFKAPDVMLRIFAAALERMPQIKLIMAGSGAMTDALKKEASATLPAGSCHFPGYVSSKQTMPYYLASDLVLFPSRYDTWSRGVNEAMIARRPCILSRVVPAAGGLVDHGHNGYVVDALEPGDFVRCIEDFIARSPGQRRAMGNAARERAQQFSYEAHTDELYRSLTEVAAP